jgi:hypothetical protein
LALDFREFNPWWDMLCCFEAFVRQNIMVKGSGGAMFSPHGRD